MVTTHSYIIESVKKLVYLRHYNYEIDEFVREVRLGHLQPRCSDVLANPVLALSLATALRSHTDQILDFTIAVSSIHLDNSTIANMSAALNKIAANSPSRASPSEIETSIANVCHPILVVASNKCDFIEITAQSRFTMLTMCRLCTISRATSRT